MSFLKSLSFIRALLLVVPFVTSVLAKAESRHVCGKDLASGIEYKWCIDSESLSTNSDVVYYFHGANRSENAWRDEADNQAIQKDWRRRGVSAPTVISVSFGGIWLLSTIPRGELPSHFDVFANQIMPALESKIGGVRGRRMVKAESMGGFNALQVLFKIGGLFERGALACPAITPVGPYSSPFDIGAFIQRNQPYVKPELLALVWGWTRREFPDEQAWASHDPLKLVNRFGPGTPKLYISCGKRDEFGFFEGSQAFALRARELGTKVLWQPMAGGHCAADPSALSRFLVP